MLPNASISTIKPGSQSRGISFIGNTASSVMGSGSWSGMYSFTGYIMGSKVSGSYVHVDGLISGSINIISQGGTHSV